ncbi:MAG TPA: alpha-amylase family glycosyl hydrolase [Polyangiaceae bacterium LLY-WYZ-15_(1-7)]|nr:alpha-amylase family glycosyl hydrolase [Polyangiaceae bacterium LLY-WYZ-15_(1-7)]HJL13054.1 alpha-amylase family glycosyl hydrolase [Polyangiaceae bacterium LLY-WYZ-15_(1-7)]HJL38909.1 alpha-amylase family glycosyl hydrolase [Polyangiaceae bacterium LLY-WYZ-15_(1-7)]
MPPSAPAEDGGDPPPEPDEDAGEDATTPPSTPGWEDTAALYFVLTDRFANGDPANDGEDECFDPAHPRRYHGGDFAGLRARAGYLEELGVDAVWITPVQRQVGRIGEGCGYHGYWADLDDPDDGAIEPRLGGAAALDALLEDFHGRGIRVVADLVVNHVGYGARLTRTRPGWFHDGRTSCQDDPRRCSLAGLPDLAQEREEVAAYLDAYSARFVRRFPFDGVRMDTVKHVPASYFAERWIPTVRAERDLWLVGELLDGSGYDPFVPYVEAGFDGLFDFPLHGAMLDAFARGGSLNGVASRVQEYVDRFGIAAARRKSQLLDNHDVPRFLQASEGRPEAERVAGYRLALATLFTVPGIPQLYYGDELGFTGEWPENRRDMPAWAFDPEARGGAGREGVVGDPGETFALTRELIALRRALPALRRGGYAELWRPNGGADVWVFFRSVGESHVVVAIHGGEEAVSGLPMPVATNPGLSESDRAALEGARFREALGAWEGGEARVEGGELVVDMPPQSAFVWVVE